MANAQIIGIMMIKNDDLHVAQVVRNAVAFCDLLLVADNGSEDRTYALVEDLAREYPAIRLMRVAHYSESHPLIEGYANSNTWVFGIDGDEIYDPRGLAALRVRLLAGEFDDYWKLTGHVVHCLDLDRKSGVARGFMAPPAISMTKLYNFAKISSWRNCPQRLHWGDLVFNSDRHDELRLCDQVGWNESEFRCLHVAFMQRSSLQETYSSWRKTRLNPSELNRNRKLDTSLGFGHVLKQIFIYPVIRWLRFDYKYRRYRKGPVVAVDLAPFMGAAVSGPGVAPDDLAADPGGRQPTGILAG